MLVFGSWGEVFRRSIQADLFISRISEKLDERSLYNKLSVFSCNPLMQLLSVLLWFIQTKGQEPNKAFIKICFYV